MLRTRVVTALAVAGVAVAGTAAIVANVGILGASESSAIGNLSAAEDLGAAAPRVVDVYLDPSTTVAPGTPSPGGATAAGSAASPSAAPGAASAPGAATAASPSAAPAGSPSAAPAAAPAAATTQTFAVGAAGRVVVRRDGATLTVTEVTPAAGWSPRPEATSGGAVAVAFTTGTRTLRFAAVPGADGGIAASVTEATTAGAPATTSPPAAVPVTTVPATSPTTVHDDEHEDEPEHEDEHEHEDEDD